MTRRLISVITPTIPERRDLLMDCIEDVRGQDYPAIEHLIVADGPDPELTYAVLAARSATPSSGNQIDNRLVELGRPWSPLLPPQSLGVAPILAGMLQARGEYLAWLCDDERFTDPGALSLLADHLEATGADFVYPKVRMWRKGGDPERGWDIGTDSPEYGQFTWCLFRADLLSKAMPRFHGPTFNDADLMQRWKAAGARHAFLDRVLVTHRADR
jgi:glycosyltransferase involved in cell wall biosynthesis